jgi:copper chaperone CopZ
MKKVFIVFLAMVTFAISAEAQEKSKNAKARFVVKGNCEMCKERIEKAALLTKGVKYANWNIDSKEFNCIYNENKVTVTDIKKAIAKVGHDTEEIKATDEAYKALHDCCQYDRENNNQ